ncbi:MAG: hypothetical protein NTX57_17075 [Armatimonadetes bacterium]|nr:hypothetical protein [Armatimonadota bacterium]
MKFQKALCLSGVALVVAGMHPAQAQKDGIERNLAGIRINSSAKSILSIFGNPNDIQIGDVAVRPPTQAGGQGQQGQGGMMGGGGMDGGMMGGPSGMSGSMGGMMGGSKMGGPSGMSGSMGGPSGMSGSMGGPSGMSGSMGGPSGMSGSMGGPSGMSGSMGGPSGMSGSMGGMMGGKMGGGPSMGGSSGMSGSMGGMMGGRGGMMGGGDMEGGGMGGPGSMGGGIGAFGQTVSSSTLQQEVTWSYSMKALDAKKQKQAIGYDFLVSPEGKVSQIRITGYVPRTRNDKSAKGLTLGSTYKDLIRTYGSPKSVMKSGELLVCSYPKQHIEFQLMNMKYVNGYTDPYNGIYKVVAIQINATE